MKIKTLFVILTASLLAIACRKRDVPLPDNVVQFETAEQGISASQNSITAKLKLSASTTADVPLTINIKEEGGLKSADYTLTSGTNIISPASGSANITIPSGSNEAAIEIKKTPNVLFSGTEKLILSIYSSGNGTVIGTQKEFTLNFSEIISTGATMELDGGGATFGNKVFVDLSANNQTAVQRTKWDLGFYTGSDAFRVILNSSTGMMAKALNKTDLSAVTAADTVGLSAQMAFNYSSVGLPFIDYPSGDLTKTAIAEISANDAENKVYIVNQGKGIGDPLPVRGWKKIRIIRNATGGYTLQHADIAATTFTSINIAKDANYFFKYISFETGAVDVEPQAKKWDLAWTYFTNTTYYGPDEIPYAYQDMIIQNRNVQVDTVLTSVKSYADFSEADIAGITFVSGQVSIGADWRTGGGPTSAPVVRSDRFYIVKDGDGNIYKVKFLSTTKNGVRGYPSFEYALIKKAN